MSYTCTTWSQDIYARMFLVVQNPEITDVRCDLQRGISRQKEEKHDSKQTETVKVSDAENQETSEKKSDVSKGNSDSPKKGDESGKDLRIRTDFTHDDIHHFKPLALKNRRDEHQKPADTTNQKEEFRKFIETAVKQKPTNSSSKSTERYVSIQFVLINIEVPTLLLKD